MTPTPPHPKTPFLLTMDRDVMEATPGRTIWEHDGDHYTRTRDGQAWKWSRVFGKYIAVTYPPPPQLRRVIACVRTMMRLNGWPRRRAIRFALEKYRRDPSPPRIRRAMSGETQEYLTHRTRSMVR